MNKIICVASPLSVGCTFMEWSIHFLSGKDQYYSVKNQQWVPLSMNPVTKSDAHGHDKNHPSGFEETVQHIKQLEQVSGVTSFYPCLLHLDLAIQQLDIDISRLTNSDALQQVKQFREKDYGQILNYCAEKNIDIVYNELNLDDLLYFTGGVRTLSRMSFSPKITSDLKEKQEEKDAVFYNDSASMWQSSGLTEIWDNRERLALCSRPLDLTMASYQYNFSYPHYWLDARSFWHHGDLTIKKIMEYLKLNVVPERFKLWLPIYLDWQKVQQAALSFSYNCQHIVDAIINNWYYKLDELTFNQEVIIQHLLIYQYGLNLKTWQLTKFPKNTQELHNLLEPNIHTIESLYTQQKSY